MCIYIFVLGFPLSIVLLVFLHAISREAAEITLGYQQDVL